MHRKAPFALGAGVLAAAAITTTLLSGGGASAAVIRNSIPAGDGTIKGCYVIATGLLSVVDSAASCPLLSTELDWSQTGPQGAPGLSGVNVQVSNPTSPHSTTASYTEETFSCSGGQTAIYGNGVLYAPLNTPNTQVPIASDGFDLTSGVPTGIKFLIPNNWSNSNTTLTISVTCATTN